MPHGIYFTKRESKCKLKGTRKRKYNTDTVFQLTWFYHVSCNFSRKSVNILNTVHDGFPASSVCSENSSRVEFSRCLDQLKWRFSFRHPFWTILVQIWIILLMVQKSVLSHHLVGFQFSSKRWVISPDLTINTSWWFQPLWKILVKIRSFPQIGVKIKKIWNHYLEQYWWCFHLAEFVGSQETLLSSHHDPHGAPLCQENGLDHLTGHPNPSTNFSIRTKWMPPLKMWTLENPHENQ